MNDGMSQMNGPIWIFAIILIGWCIVQAALFSALALRFNRRHNLMNQMELQTCVKTGIVSVIGPALNAVFFAVSLITLIGTPLTFMRLSVIGSPMMEFNMAQYAAVIQNIPLGSGSISAVEFTYILYGLQMACLPFLVVTMILLPPLDKAVNRSKQRKQGGFLPKAIGAMGVGVIAYTCMMYLTGPAQIGALLSAVTVSALIDRLAKTRKINWLLSFNFVISLASGMVVGQLISSFVPA